MARLPAVALGLLLLCGCGAAPRDEERTPAAAPLHSTSVPDGYRRHAVRESGVSVALPVGWQVLAQRDVVFPGVLATLTRLDRSFRAPAAALGSPDSPLKLFAFDRRFWRGRPTTAMVVQFDYRRPGRFTAWSERIRRSLAAAPGRRGPLESAPVVLHGNQGLRTQYRTADGSAVVLYVLAARTGLWALVFRTPGRLLAARSAAFAAAAATLEVAVPVGGAQAPARSGPGA